jgi:hypothetical protein
MSDVFPTRIHIAPLGVESDRITEPAINQGADRVILIKYLPKEVDDRLAIDQIEARFEEAGIVVEYEHCEGEVTDLYDAVAKFGEVMLANRDDEVYVNLATGDKDTTIGGMIACMTLGIATPYYVEAETRGTLQRQPPEGVNAVDSIPPYPMERPTDEHLAVMRRIETGDNVDKSALIRFAAGEDDSELYDKEDLVAIGEESDPVLPFLSGLDEIFEERVDYPRNLKPTKAAFGRLNTHIINPLEEKEFIEIKELGTRHRITLTPAGENMLRAFEYVVEPGQSG